MDKTPKTQSKQANLTLLLIVVPFVSGVIVWGIVMLVLGQFWPDAPNSVRSFASLAALLLGMVMGALIERRMLSRKSER
jgi:membrane associated rhomboid family serine protease